jgi:hypothetical protein
MLSHTGSETTTTSVSGAMASIRPGADRHAVRQVVPGGALIGSTVTRIMCG